MSYFQSDYCHFHMLVVVLGTLTDLKHFLKIHNWLDWRHHYKKVQNVFSIFFKYIWNVLIHLFIHSLSHSFIPLLKKAELYIFPPNSRTQGLTNIYNPGCSTSVRQWPMPPHKEHKNWNRALTSLLADPILITHERKKEEGKRREEKKEAHKAEPIKTVY